MEEKQEDIINASVEIVKVLEKYACRHQDAIVALVRVLTAVIGVAPESIRVQLREVVKQQIDSYENQQP